MPLSTSRNPPGSFIGPVVSADRDEIIQTSLLHGHYEKSIDRESAYERLRAKASAGPAIETIRPPAATKGRQPETMAEAMMKSVVRAAGSQMGRSLIRGVLGSILGGRR